MDFGQDLWINCAQWLKDVGVLAPQHKIYQPGATMFDLAQTLRDGVVLCNAMNQIYSSAINESNIHCHAQMSQFLCTQNLWTVVNCLKTTFGLDSVFHPFDLYHMTDFAKVLTTLSDLSHLPFVAERFRPFPDKNQSEIIYQQSKEEDIYNSLADLACERNLADEEDLYDSVAEEKEEGIYGSLIAFKREPSINNDQRNVRSYCIDEIMETEKNYVNHLDMVCSKFIQPLKSRYHLSDKDANIVFMNTTELLPVHRGFLDMLHKYRNHQLSKPFLDYKEKFLIYGSYCSLMAEAQEHLDCLMKQDNNFKTLVEELQETASPNKFRLRELLCVPMQRVLKYHLLVKELNKHTPENSSDKAKMGKALEAMQELSHFVNEVKRDNEMSLTINKVQSCLVGFSSHMSLSMYGRLLKDGELKVKVANEKNKPKLRNVFLFDQALIMTKEENGNYNLKDNLRLEEENFTIDEIFQQRGGKWSFSWWMRGRSSQYQLFAKTQLEKSKWIEHIQIAFDKILPSPLRNKPWKFNMHTFIKPTYCDSCHKLLLGTFFQGYLCESIKVKSHKHCLNDVVKKLETGVPLTTRPERPGLSSISSDPERSPTIPDGRPPTGGKQERPSSVIMKTIYKAHRDYKGMPKPPFAAQTISFEIGEEVQVDERLDNNWWKGWTFSAFDVKGFFPASFVSPIAERRSSIVLPPNSSRTMPPLTTYKWYAGELDRQAAETLLIGKPTGTFLVRVKESHSYAISLMFQEDIKHIRLWRSPDNLYYLAECKHFRSIQELVGFYQENIMSKSFLGLETTLKYPIFPSISPTNSLSSSGDIRPNLGKVLYDFDPRSEPELGLRTGQIVTIVSKKGDSHGWWKVKCEGQVGYVPASFIKEIN